MNLVTTSAAVALARQSKLVIDFVAAAMNAGDVAEAERLLRDRLAKAPNDADALAKLAEIAVDQLRIEEATILLRRAVDANPQLQRCLDLIVHLRANVGPTAVLQALETVPQHFRRNFQLRGFEAEASGTLGFDDREIAIWQDLTRLAPDHPGQWLKLGNALKTVGRVDEAVAAMRQAIRCRPTFGEAYWALANFKSFTFGDSDIAAMRRALKKNLVVDDSRPFHFALGQALEDRRLYQQAFRHYTAGNSIHAATLHAPDMFVTRFVNAALPLFSREFFEQRAGAGCAASDPIFVVGMHRSGSTLIEQILATHPLIEGTTEISVMQKMWHRLFRLGVASGRGAFGEVARLDHKAIREAGQEYLDRTRAFRTTDRPFFVDKFPANWMHLGLIRIALPNARIIDARRHPMACGFSNFKQNYGIENPFSFSQEAVGAFYRDYWRFMTQFDEVQPNAAHRILNERLIEDPEGEIRRMLDFIGVPFDPACLDFHANNRAVRTPSAEQVRRPINRDGVDHWKHYEPWLDPLKQALGPALEQWDN